MYNSDLILFKIYKNLTHLRKQTYVAGSGSPVSDLGPVWGSCYVVFFN